MQAKLLQKIGQISAGETIKIQCPVKMQRTKSGTIRIPLVNGGWVTAQTKSGKALVEEYVCEIHENTPCCDGNEASFQSPTDVLASLKARKASLESTRKRIEETIEKSNAITNATRNRGAMEGVSGCIWTNEPSHGGKNWKLAYE